MLEASLACACAVIWYSCEEMQGTHPSMGFFDSLLGDLKSRLNSLFIWKFLDFSDLRRDTKISLL